MTTAFRAVLAFALLAGFYVLVGLVLGAAVFFDVLLFVDFHARGVQVAIVLTLAAGALVRALVMVGRLGGGEQPGVAVGREHEPVLWQTVEELARRVGTAPPDEIRLVAEVNAAVSEETRFLGLRAVRRRMFVGLPLLQTLTVDEARAVLGHELGHYSGAHTRLGAPVYRGRVSLVATVRSLDDHPFIRRLFTLYATLYLRVSQAVSRRQELEADAMAVSIAGRRAMAAALRKIEAAALGWDVYASSYLSMAGLGGARPASVFGGFHALMSDPGRQTEISRQAAEPREVSPYDSHPSVEERLAAIERLPEPPLTPDPRSALALLRDPDVAVQAVEQAMWTPEALATLRPVPWEELVAEGMFHGRNEEALHDLAVAGGRVMGTDLPYLDAAFEAIARGRQAELEARLRELGWNPSETLLAGVLGQALEGVLVRLGQARWTLSWSGPARLLFGDGEEVALDAYAAQIAATPSAVAGLRRWLGNLGMRPDFVPLQAPAGPAPGPVPGQAGGPVASPA
ncbi:M48 family metallopeptidase [Nonomuraea pusilla]|uniref:Zn-dependent protease with chaperone function n=1 Tax=Nonomuraea pusilla TaxID=46177 RepID=A0A1H7SFY6_9ACTN|nr:M48 family metallopeptidase [Nonomuraea pusilla]SEL71542.1 Zn-dependent protease with chaperone function [Nonomuraea pusilla]